jgi:ligand-binding SRPBCC domain-containing protein
MPVFEHHFEVDAPVAAVRAFHGSPEALRVLTPPGTFLRLERFGPLEEGMIAEFRLWLGPVPVDWVARHEEVSDGGFTDVMVEGPLARWAHRHVFEALGPQRSAVIDRIAYAHPPGAAGAWTRVAFGRPALASLFAYRAWATRRAVARGDSAPSRR